MKKFFYKLWSGFLTCFGNIKIFNWPMWIVYDPSYFKMTGEKIIQVSKTLNPGDIILRGFEHYLDGKFVPSKSGWSHGAIYVGNDVIIHAVS